MFYCKENDKVIETGVLVLFQMLFFYLLNKFIFQDQLMIFNIVEERF